MRMCLRRINVVQFSVICQCIPCAYHVLGSCRHYVNFLECGFGVGIMLKVLFPSWRVARNRMSRDTEGPTNGHTKSPTPIANQRQRHCRPTQRPNNETEQMTEQEHRQSDAHALWQACSCRRSCRHNHRSRCSSWPPRSTADRRRARVAPS